MRISESCAACLYDKQKNKTNDEEYLSEIRSLLDNRKETDTSPYMVYLFNKVHVRRFGAGAVYDLMPETAKKALDEADVLLAKGQGNYETMSDQGRLIFYEFLCKCDLFTSRFKVPRLTGIFTEEK